MKPHVAGLLVLLCACTASPPRVSGSWSVQVTAPDGQTESIAFDLQARDSILTGTVSGGPFQAPEAIQNGRLLRDSVSFSFRVSPPNGQPNLFQLAGMVSGNRMQGSIGDEHSDKRFTFTATRGGTAHGEPQGNAGERQHDVTRAPSDLEPPNPQGSDPTPQDAQRAILAAFDKYDVVGLGILSYANQDFDQFILDLIRNPAFPDKVNDIAVECGNSLYQPVLDRHIAGENLPLAQVQRVWRNTTQPFCGATTFYEELVPLVRQVNEKLPVGRKLRVLAGDPPVNWDGVRTREDLRPFEDRDANIAAVMEHEVLAKHRKALMIFGARHLMHGGGGAVARYERSGYPDRTFIIIAHNGFGTHSPLSRFNAALERRLASWPIPSLVTLRGTWLDDLPRPYFPPFERGGGPISAAVDGYLYLGPGDVLLNQPMPAPVVLDTAYVAELRRRARIRAPDGVEPVMREARNPSVFFNH